MCHVLIDNGDTGVVSSILWWREVVGKKFRAKSKVANRDEANEWACQSQSGVGLTLHSWMK